MRRRMSDKRHFLSLLFGRRNKNERYFYQKRIPWEVAFVAIGPHCRWKNTPSHDNNESIVGAAANILCFRPSLLLLVCFANPRTTSIPYIHSFTFEVISWTATFRWHSRIVRYSHFSCSSAFGSYLDTVAPLKQTRDNNNNMLNKTCATK